MINSTKTLYPFNLEHDTYKLMNRMLNPMCGLVQELGFIKRNKFGSRIYTAGADITGVHTLLNQEDPGRGAYHTGGSGIYLNEPVIKSLGETVERYAQLTAEINIQHESLFCPYSEMKNKKHNILSQEYLDLYNSEQLSRAGFPFAKFDESLPLTWINSKSINSAASKWIPAQLLLVGYHVKKDLNEPWYSTAVTTGTAAHTSQTAALLNAILELIQIDSAMGHWYSTHEIPKILFDERTKPMENILKKYDKFNQDFIHFFWLKNSDLPGFTIACLLEKPENCIPRVSIGLGASTSLNDALYKSYLEAVGVSNLSNILILKQKFKNNSNSEIDLNNIYDIDTNVALYGRGINYSRIQERFNKNRTIKATDISPDIAGSRDKQLRCLIRGFLDTGKELNILDLTNKEANALGFFVPRVWSKDTLSLCFPSAPPVRHPRFSSYGGLTHAEPHPYP